ncbi:MAG: DUF177 domain-containing protein [Candidatus Adiutrix sp.]|jgi:uncharacterized protein|nr:DUF177 domain-containing protein [Candidatus Adiutrix sp.]
MTFLVTVDDIPPEGLDLILDLSPEDLANLVSAQGQERPLARSPLTGSLRLTRPDHRLAVRGNFEVKLSVTCDRCLNEFDFDLAGRVEEILTLAPPGQTGNEDQDDQEGDGALEIKGGQADLSALVAEHFWLAWPFRFICRPDCAGLCPHCGTDLNQGPCNCSDKI